jgi:UDP-N-acetyl-D-glucosamine/UDP-N-acetyl-D-galactosamine dehydrogenase
VIVAVAHEPFQKLGWAGVTSLLANGHGVVADVKNLLPRTNIPEGVTLWRL